MKGVWHIIIDFQILGIIIGLISSFIMFHLGSKEKRKQKHLEDIKSEVLQPMLDNVINIYLPVLEKEKEIITVRYPYPHKKEEKIQIVPFYESDISKKEVNETLYADIEKNHKELTKGWGDFHSQFEKYSNNWVLYSEEIFDKINDELKLSLYDRSGNDEFINTWKLATYIVNYTYGFKKLTEIKEYENELRTSNETILKCPSPEKIKKCQELIDKLKKDDSKSKELEPTRRELLSEAYNLKSKIDKGIKTYKLSGNCEYV